MEVQKSGPSGQQQPVGTEHRVEQVIGYFYALPFEDQQALLLIAAAEIIPRLTDLTPQEFIHDLEDVPAGDNKISTERGGAGHIPNDQALTREEVYEDWMRQSVGAQKHILQLVGPRVMTNLRGPDRDRYLHQVYQLILDAMAGGSTPTIH